MTALTSETYVKNTIFPVGVSLIQSDITSKYFLLSTSIWDCHPILYDRSFYCMTHTYFFTSIHCFEKAPYVIMIQLIE